MAFDLFIIAVGCAHNEGCWPVSQSCVVPVWVIIYRESTRGLVADSSTVSCPKLTFCA
jgi:hypothetical protein